MNDKIKELAIRSGVVESHVDWEAAGGNLLEKFAELLIVDCIRLCAKIEDSYLEGDDSNTDIAIGAAVCGYDIGKYFGVDIQEPKKVCKNKIDGSCTLHNIFCGYPECEILKGEE